jgi:group I intron endonuclease
MRQGTIYLIENKVNGNKYVGQTVMPLNKRWLAHIQESKTFSERPLYRAINKYGLDNFNIKVIEETDEDKLSEREIYWIEHFNSYNRGYNATTGGESNKNIREDIRDKISESMSNVSRSDEWKDNISIGLKSKLERGERWGFFLTKNPGGEHCKRKVQATSIETGEVVEFDSTREASLKIKGSEKYAGNICRAIKDNGTSYGYKWKRLDDRPIIRPVVGYDKKTGELVYEFESANKASLSIRGKRGTGLSKSLKNPGKNSWMGCYWYYET